MGITEPNAAVPYIILAGCIKIGALSITRQVCQCEITKQRSLYLSDFYALSLLLLGNELVTDELKATPSNLSCLLPFPSKREVALYFSLA